MSLFQNSVLNKYLKEQDKEVVKAAFDKYRAYFHNPDIQRNILEAKEEQFQEGFLRELFVKVFGYVLNPRPDYNLTTEYKNEKGAKKADGAILNPDKKSGGKAVAVIELKSTKTKDLESIRQQAFDYKANQTGCVYVITSNFQKLRFYINDAVEFEEFDLFILSQERFEVLFLCLNAENILSDLPLRIKNASILEEEQITKKFYADYSSFKKDLFESMVDLNMGIEGVTKILLYKKTQKLLDRFLFIFFAEDRGLLPPNSISRMIRRWNVLKDEDAYKPLYEIFKQYFGYLNTGRKGKVPADDIHEYNGGLFLPDEVLDKIEIDDDVLLRHTSALTNYDFESQVGVNILGHIFEHSLNEIESTTAELEGVDFDKQKSKRKKDGVFYTPKYITKYIVDNTVGKLCEEKKFELGIKEDEFTPNRQKETKKRLLANLEKYRSWLLELTICDPACGSGAFLNRALEYLISEHHYIDDLNARLFGSTMVFQDVENQILENNIFGVDINEESVEIARLSLWLRTAQRGRKLTTLNKNIKCGNSLIDDPEVAGEKAFTWQDEFPGVFAKGGFDVVIGNPPYVRIQLLKHEEIDWYKEHMQVAHKRIDISIMFMELGNKMLSHKGLLAYITSNQFLNSEYGRKCRQLLLRDYKIEKIVDFGDLPIFEGALTYVSIFNLRKEKPGDFLVYKIKNIETAINGDYRNPFKVNHSSLDEEVWILKDEKQDKILKRLQNMPNLDSIASCNYGIVTGNDSVFILTNDIIRNNMLERDLLLPLIRANNCGRYEDVGCDLYVLYPYDLKEGKTKLMNEAVLRNKYPNAYGYLSQHKNELMTRKDSRKTFEERDDWFTLTRFGRIQMFNEMKIVFPGETKRNKFGIDKNKAGYSGARVFSITINHGAMGKIDIYGLLGILNSTLIEFYLHSLAPLKQGGYYSYSSTLVNKVPIKLGVPLKSIGNLSKRANEITTELVNVRNKLIRYLVRQIATIANNRKIKTWDDLEFVEFIKELNKANKKAHGEKLSKMDEMEWMEVFESKKAEAQSLKTEINHTDKEIDRMVYELYGLTEEEIRIVEDS